MIICQANRDDIDQMVDIYIDSYNSINIGEKWDRQSAKTMLLHLFEIQPDLTFVAKIEGKIVGAANALIKPWWDGNRLTDGEIFVNPKYQGKKIGKRLIKHLFMEAKKKYNAVSWDTFTHIIHKHPLSWYKSMGFEEIKEWAMISGKIDTVLKKLDKELGI